MGHNALMSEDTTTPTPAIPDGARALPSGGWVILSDPDAATGKDKRRIRTAYDENGGGSAINKAMEIALGIRVVSWHLPYKVGATLPRYSPAILDELSAKDLGALEEMVDEWTSEMLGRKKKGAEEDPTLPVSA